MTHLRSAKRPDDGDPQRRRPDGPLDAVAAGDPRPLRLAPSGDGEALPATSLHRELRATVDELEVTSRELRRAHEELAALGRQVGELRAQLEQIGEPPPETDGHASPPD